MAAISQSASDIHDAQDVERFVGEFYARVQTDPVLGDMFDRVAQVDWEEHLPTMYQFWNMVLFSRAGYAGNPLVVHTQFNELLKEDKGTGVQAQDFDRWLMLFTQTIDGLFSGPNTDGAKLAAFRIARHLSAVLSSSGDELFPLIPKRTH